MDRYVQRAYPRRCQELVMSGVTPTTQLLPGWEVIKRDYVEPGIPMRLVVRTAPLVALFLDEGSTRLGVSLEVGESELPTSSPFEELCIGIIRREGVRQLEASTNNRSLFPNFYKLAAEVVTAVTEKADEPSAALSEAIARWDSLLSRSSILSEERQAGLFGELWFLERLILTKGEETALSAWVGPAGSAHDFRLHENEFEVKTTSGSRRVHRINGVGQLEPSLGCRLYILSLQLADAGAGGLTLAEQTDKVELLLSANLIERFRKALGNVGYQVAEVPYYPKRRRLRHAPVLVPVIDGTPRLTNDAVRSLPVRFSPELLGRITYDIDVSGLGFPDGSPEFNEIVTSLEQG